MAERNKKRENEGEKKMLRVCEGRMYGEGKERGE